MGVKKSEIFFKINKKTPKKWGGGGHKLREVERVPYGGLTHIRRHNIEIGHSGDPGPIICAFLF